MSSPPGSSGQTPIYWGSESDRASPEPAQTGSPQYYHAANAPRPRLSSPRLFQDFFGSTRRHDTRLLPAPSNQFHSLPQDFPQAFENVNRAVQTTQQAFQDGQVVDLTDSPPVSPLHLSLMPPQTRRRSGPSTAATTIHELSSSPPDHIATSSQPRHAFDPTRSALLPNIHDHLDSRRRSAEQPHRTKRRRLEPNREEDDDDDVRFERSQPVEQAPEIEAVDLTGVNDATGLSQALSKQRQDAVRAQMQQAKDEEPAGRTPLSSYKCPICMDTPEDATTTICGHLFCHKCIVDTLRYSENQRNAGNPHAKSKGVCPVCRKALARGKDKAGQGRALIPLELKLLKKSQVDVKGKGVVRQGVLTPSNSSKTAKKERESSAEMWNDLTLI